MEKWQNGGATSENLKNVYSQKDHLLKFMIFSADDWQYALKFLQVLSSVKKIKSVNFFVSY